MDNWQPGDPALCVKSGKTVRAGEVRLVVSVSYIADCNGSVGLFLEGKHSFGGFLPGAYQSRLFRKIHPHAPDAEDRETIELLTGKPLLAPVGGGEG